MSKETTTEQLAEIEGQGAEPEPQPQPVQVREGRWRTRNGLVKDVTAMPTNHEDFAAAYPWWDGVSTWRNDGRWLAGGSTMDLREYLGPLEPQPQPQAESDTELQAQVAFLKGREVTLGTRLQQEREVTTRLRGDLELVQKLLGTEKQRVTELEELVGSLRTINEAQEKSVRLAGQENTDLKHRLEVVSAEWAEQSETVRKLQIELDAAQQVPQAVSDRFEEGWDAGTSQAVETIAEWLEPIRHLIDAADNMAETEQASNLAADIIRALPAIMRSLTGLTPED